ncbi:hypothetical protein [Coxiella burnetii]|uniref:hypothetical protein n=1 Tax=Coxiella burnetii TaxID=777 RepID=UPI0002E38177
MLIAATIIENDKLKTTKEKRYQAWKEPLNANMLSGKLDFETIAKRALDNNLDPKPTSGEQEKLERWLSER